MSIARSVDADGRGSRTWRFKGYEVTRLVIDYRFTFDCARGLEPRGSLTITIGVPFKLACPDGIEAIDPSDASSVGKALVILHKQLLSLSALPSGPLIVDFEGDLRLMVEKHEQYEAWETFGEGEAADMGMLCTAEDRAPWGDKPGQSQDAR